MSDLLKYRNEKRKKLPKFKRQDAHKKVKVGQKWRKPKGLHNKMRLQFRGYRKIVKAGYGTPAELRGTTEKGLMPVRIFSIEALKKLDPKKNILIIASSVGAKNKLKIIEEAKKLGLGFLNFNTEKYTENINKVKALKAEKRKKKAAKDKKKEKEQKDKPLEEQVKKEEKEISDEEKKKQDKAEKDKLLTKAK
ncbi:MAG: eL32 family ribosomal protein [archaeon]